MWNTVATRDVRLLKHQLDSVFALPKQFVFLNYLRCHDDIGWGLDFDYLKQFGIEEVAHKKYINDYLKGAYWGSNSRGELYNDDPRLGDARMCGTTASLCGIEAAEYEKNEFKQKEAIKLDIMLHAFLLTQTGMPVLYSGDEIGQLNDYTYHDDPVKCEDSRYIHRGNFNWDEAALRNDETTRQGKLFQTIKKLENIRPQDRASCSRPSRSSRISEKSIRSSSAMQMHGHSRPTTIKFSESAVIMRVRSSLPSSTSARKTRRHGSMRKRITLIS